MEVRTIPVKVEKTTWQRLAIFIGLWGLLNRRVPGEPAKSNQITTAKYTVISFLPINLYQQFMRLANLYFLVVAVSACAHQTVPGYLAISSFLVGCGVPAGVGVV